MSVPPVKETILSSIAIRNWFDQDTPIKNLENARDKAKSITQDLKSLLLSTSHYGHDDYNYIILVESHPVNGSSAASHGCHAQGKNDFYLTHEIIQDGFSFFFHVWGVYMRT